MNQGSIGTTLYTEEEIIMYAQKITENGRSKCTCLYGRKGALLLAEDGQVVKNETAKGNSGQSGGRRRSDGGRLFCGDLKYRRLREGVRAGDSGWKRQQHLCPGLHRKKKSSDIL